MPDQDKWRYCTQCSALFFDGHSDNNKGVCPGAAHGARGHHAEGYNFNLPYDVHPTPKSQADWRNCWKCQAMYFNGHADGNKGACPDGGSHDGHGFDPVVYNFVLPFNISETSTSQAKWRNCWKCQMMFFDGYENEKGLCAAGERHEGHGDNPKTYNFVLPHR